MLMGDHSNKHRPIAYYSIELDSAVCAYPNCFKATGYSCSCKVSRSLRSLGNDIYLQTPHAVRSLLNSELTKHFSESSLTSYESLLLSSPNVFLKRCNVP